MKKILLFLTAFAICGCSYAQMVGTNVFLKGKYVELGMNNNGSIGACTGTPSGYHTRPNIGATTTELGMVYDINHDGWSVGTPPFIGNYTFPDTPYEGWALQVGGVRTQVFQSCSGSIPSGGLGISGANTDHYSIWQSKVAKWAGSALGGQLVIKQETLLDSMASSVYLTVKMYNTGSTPLANVYYLRTCDADNDAATGGGSFTFNTIIYQNDAANRVQVESRSASTVRLSMGAKDARARAFINASWPMSPSALLDTLFANARPAGYTQDNDISIGLVFNLGTLAAGDSASFSYCYIFRNGVAAFDSAVAAPCTGMPTAGVVSANTPIACPTTPVVLNVAGYSTSPGTILQWQSSADSVTWTNVTGAVSPSYSFTGLTATRFYRVAVICNYSGLTAYTAGLKVAYSVPCPCLHTAGSVWTGASTACTSTLIYLNSLGHTVSPDVSLQWQSSPDSAVWTDIPGATTVPYSFSGLSATTYYRLNAFCVPTAQLVTSEGRKVVYTVSCDCSGTPAGGIATSDVSTCDGCTISLNLPGMSPMTGLTYQWQKSLNGTSGWSNIAGATSLSHTYAPDISSYYRCMSTCAFGGSSYSTSVLVTVPIKIVDDSVKHISSTSCDQSFYVKINAVGTAYKVKTFFGDGTSAINSFTGGSGGYMYMNIGHVYATPGHYSVMHVLLNGTVAIDTVTFSYVHTPCNVVKLRFFVDQDGDCVKANTEKYSNYPAKIRVDSAGVVIDTVSATSGFDYRIFGPTGTMYTFTILPTGVFGVCPSSGVITETITTGINLYSFRLISVDCSSTSFYDFKLHVNFQCTPWSSRALISGSNWLCSPTDMLVTHGISPKYKYSAAANFSPTVASYGDHYVSWLSEDVSSISSFLVNPRRLAMFSTNPAYTLSIGDTVHTRYSINPTVGDINPWDNIIDRVDIVRAAFDPNVIEVAPAGCYENDTILEYTVHFENMGNDTAYNVHVLDTLSDNLDIKSLEILHATADMFLYQYKDGPYNIVKFDFPNIKLLDSSWHGLNEGMFVFKMRTKPGLAVGQTIQHRVGIYFDHNEVVMTNTVENTKGCPVVAVDNVSKGQLISLFPNPTTGELTIKTDGQTFTSFTITNAVGQQIWQQGIGKAQERVELGHLPAGVYYVTLRGEQGSEVRKFVKW